jgi:hypothetical protein
MPLPQRVPPFIAAGEVTADLMGRLFPGAALPPVPPQLPPSVCDIGASTGTPWPPKDGDERRGPDICAWLLFGAIVLAVTVCVAVCIGAAAVTPKRRP